MNKGVKQGYIYVFLSAILWGMLPVFTRLLYAAGSTPLEVSSVRAYLGQAWLSLQCFSVGIFGNAD